MLVGIVGIYIVAIYYFGSGRLDEQSLKLPSQQLVTFVPEYIEMITGHHDARYEHQIK
jgi:hypothetical protein